MQPRQHAHATEMPLASLQEQLDSVAEMFQIALINLTISSVIHQLVADGFPASKGSVRKKNTAVDFPGRSFDEIVHDLLASQHKRKLLVDC